MCFFAGFDLFCSKTICVSFPVLHLFVLATKHCIHFTIWINFCQTPGRVVVEWDYQCMIQHICLCNCVCLITCIQVISNCICFFYQSCKLFVGIKQIFGCFCFFYIIDLRLAGRIVCVIISVSFLTKVVLWVTVVSTPTVSGNGVEFWSVNFCCSTGDIGLDVYYDKIITQAAGYGLFEYISAIQRNLVSRCNVVIQTNWEGYTQSCQFFDCSLFVFFCFFCIQTCLLYTSPSPRDCS